MTVRSRALGRNGGVDQEVRESGAFLSGEGLAENSTATTVPIGGDGERIVSEGPFAETKEVLGGYYLLECKDLDEALDWAKQIPATAGAIEVRRVMDYGAYGGERTAQGG